MRTKPHSKPLKMKINNMIVADTAPKMLCPDDFNLPYTLGGVPEEQQVILDSCFAPVSSLLEHSIKGLAAEGIPMFVGYGVLTGLAQVGIVRAGVEMRSDEMTRKWGEFVRTGDNDDTDADDNDDKVKKLNEDAVKYKLPAIFNKASSYCGYYGGTLGFIDTGEAQDRWADPLILSQETIKQGGFKGVKLIEPYVVSPGYYNSVNPMADDYFKPTLWYVQGIPVHASRMLYFAENALPTILRPAYNFFGLSLAQKVLDAVSHFTGCRESANRLLEKYSLTVFKTDMTEILSGGMDTTLQQRIQYFVQNRSNDGCATIDKEKEDLVVMTTSLAGVTDLVRQAMEYVAAMFNEPVTKMWGLSPAGFNTGDSDLRNHYDNIESLQQKMFGEPMTRLCKLLQLNAFGEIDPAIEFKFAPLSEDDEALKITNNKTKAETNVMLMDAGVVAPEEVREQLINDPDSGFNNLEPYDPAAPSTDPLEPFDLSLDPLDNPDIERKEVTIDANFNESDHKRDADEKFTSGGGSSESGNELTKSAKELMGKEYKGYTGQKAIDKLLQEKNGHIKNAFTREDIGGISVLWGDDKAGLKHIITQRTKQGFTQEKLDKFFSELGNVIETGALGKNDRGTFELSKDGKVAVVSPELHENNFTFLLTAFKRRTKK